jgi:hypothetical protein
LKENSIFILPIFSNYIYIGLICGNYDIFILYRAFSLTVCETRTQKVIAVSTEDNVQPFKDKMDKFLNSGKLVI